jgi:nucleoside-diphosphate-sugar epimerase
VAGGRGPGDADLLSQRIILTGGAGFIGRSVVRQLAARGDRVVALVRDPGKAAFLEAPNVELVRSDLADAASVAERLYGGDGLIHGAGSYKVGIGARERPAMWDANVGTTERVLGAARTAGTPRIAYVSTVGIFGDTHGREVDETYRRDPAAGFVSCYDETKFRAHEVAEEAIANGLPVVIAQPGQVYGPGDHTQIGELLGAAYRGKLRYLALGEVALEMAHVDDTAAGIIAVLDRGRVGEAYVIGGEPSTLAASVALAARLGGHRPQRLTVPTGLLRVIASINDRFGGLPGMPANLHETIQAAQASFLATHAKATRELGFEPRSLEQGIADTFGVHS